MELSDDLTSEELAAVLANESMGLPVRVVNQMLDWETHREDILLTPLPGAGIGEILGKSLKRIFYSFRRGIINATYGGRDMRFESHEEYEDWRRKISY